MDAENYFYAIPIERFLGFLRTRMQQFCMVLYGEIQQPYDSERMPETAGDIDAASHTWAFGNGHALH